ncbi:MAG: sugar phosphate isomerase/epimerase [Chloroflexi bacterium]|nr:sugar phosphate isomerase/epimerase [Chloroflexota bacterium]
MIKLSLFVTSPDFRAQDGQSIELTELCGPIEDSVRSAKRLGYDAIELMTGDPEVVDAGDLAAVLARHGMEISAINSGGLNYMYGGGLVHADARTAEMIYSKYQCIIRLAGQLGCLAHVGVARGRALEGRPLWYYRDRLVEILRAACDYASGYGVNIVLEHTNRFEHNTIYTPREAIDVIDRVDRPNLGLAIDTYHTYLEVEDPYEAIRSAKDYVRYFHLHDSDRGPAAASNGELDFDRVFGVLKEIGYSGFLADGLLTAVLPEQQIQRSTTSLRRLIHQYAL